MTLSFRITHIKTRALSALLTACFLISAAEYSFAVPDDQLAATVTDEDVEILARGPVHEAFASQVNNDAQPGIIVPNQPPEAIDEVPPEYKPDGENVIWIPGYWAWDDTKEDFIWISGVWRTAPAMKRWVPGYWHKVAEGYQWVSGFWSAQSNRTVDYRSAPPQSLESGPSTVRPSSDHFWVPGVWVHRNGYRWRPGYWCRHRADFIYTPSYWVWTPRGHIFVDGYWDYRLPARGCMFAPVYFPSPVFRRPVVRYCPSVVIDIGAMHSHWFVRPNYCHYYFGDFYDSAWSHRHHIHPGFNFHIRMGGYDPCFSYYHWHFGRMGMNYYNRMNHLHSHLHAHPHLRPGHTFGAQLSFSRSSYGRSFGISFFAHSVNNYVNHHHHGRGFVHVGLAQRRVHHDHSSTYASVSLHRHIAEHSVGVNVAFAKNTPPRPGRVNLPADHHHKSVTQAVAVRQARLHAESQKLSTPAEIDPIRPSTSALVKPNERPRPTPGEAEVAGPMRPGSARPPVATKPGPMRTDTASVSPVKPENPGPRIETPGTVKPTVNRKGKKVEITAPAPTAQVPESVGQAAESLPESTAPAPATRPNPVGKSGAEPAAPSRPEATRPEAKRPVPKPTRPSTTEKAPAKNTPVARPPSGNGNPNKRERIEGNKPSPKPNAEINRPIERPIVDTPKPAPAVNRPSAPATTQPTKPQPTTNPPAINGPVTNRPSTTRPTIQGPKPVARPNPSNNPVVGNPLTEKPASNRVTPSQAEGEAISRPTTPNRAPVVNSPSKPIGPVLNTPSRPVPTTRPAPSASGAGNPAKQSRITGSPNNTVAPRPAVPERSRVIIPPATSRPSVKPNNAIKPTTPRPTVSPRQPSAQFPTQPSTNRSASGFGNTGKQSRITGSNRSVAPNTSRPSATSPRPSVTSPRPTVSPRPSSSPRPSVTSPRPSNSSPRPSVSPRPSSSPRPSVAPRPSSPSPRPAVSSPRPSPRPSVRPSSPSPARPSVSPGNAGKNARITGK